MKKRVDFTEPPPYTARLQAFLYVLLREQVVFGELERILKMIESCDEFEFSEKQQAAYADSLVERLLRKPKEKK